MERSKVKWFDGKKGYGFILNPMGGEDVFVHFSAIVSEQTFKVLNQDAEVEFELEKTQKGYQAKNVRELGVKTEEDATQSGSQLSVETVS
ncbi:cold-shock protein [Chlorobium sp.]|jgi:CspA family cold shock protein|uniref:cold-shock protein n=1 Tax=Chlorobium sp. TaxID=1095 RepID=UPI003C618271|nr:cold shock domain-containing protein [Chlorobiaceae bacterium]NTW93813.1 cold shock domain-containing protein [Chlorobiaceae bacterium]